MERLILQILMNKWNRSKQKTKYLMLNFMIKAFKMNFKDQISKIMATLKEYCSI